MTYVGPNGRYFLDQYSKPLLVKRTIDGWTIGRSFIPESIEQCHRYGRMVAEPFRDLSDIIWRSGVEVGMLIR